MTINFYRDVSMCDVKKYSEIYKDIKALQPEDTLQLVLEAETEEEKVIAQNLF